MMVNDYLLIKHILINSFDVYVTSSCFFFSLFNSFIKSTKFVTEKLRKDTFFVCRLSSRAPGFWELVLSGVDLILLYSGPVVLF